MNLAEIRKKAQQAKKQTEDSEFQPLNIACVFSPPAEGNKDVQQLQEDLQQEKEDNQQNQGNKSARLEQYQGQRHTPSGLRSGCRLSV